MKNGYMESYKRVIQDYFQEFIRVFCMERVRFLTLFLVFGIMFMWDNWLERIRMDGIFDNWINGIPILFTLFSGALHRVSLPFMMYLVPCSREQRERYIQRMLAVKVAVPMGFGVVCDGVAVWAGSLSRYVFVLQMASVFFLSCLCGMLNEGGMAGAEKRKAYGELQPFAAAMLAVCNLVGMAMFVICMGSVSQVEFWIVISAMALFLLPMLATVGKRWKQIRRNFADYEMAAETVE
ncbi:MAG TPA: hypothetical protein DCZ91_00900 [Lachnospiraceae bacterium]|nr:hypothetical protein [Lachnospiraceae bacterium]